VNYNVLYQNILYGVPHARQPGISQCMSSGASAKKSNLMHFN